jgi:hypothetical protein
MNVEEFIVQESIIEDGFDLDSAVDDQQQHSTNKQTIKLISIATTFKLVLRVKEHFGFGATEAEAAE